MNISKSIKYSEIRRFEKSLFDQNSSLFIVIVLKLEHRLKKVIYYIFAMIIDLSYNITHSTIILHKVVKIMK